MSKNKKHIKAWQLFLIGLFFSVGARLVVGGIVGSLFAILGDILIIISIVQAIVSGVKKLSSKSGGNADNSEGIRATTEDTCNTILTSFLAIKEKYDHPIETPSDKLQMYTRILRLRPGYTDTEIKRVLEAAHKLSVQKGEEKGISLNTLIFSIIVYEYSTDIKKNLTFSQMSQIESAIKSTFNQGV